MFPSGLDQRLCLLHTFQKGIVLAGGYGTRLAPATWPISKQLLPVFDKPMIYYPLSTLMLAGIRDYLLICTAHDLPLYERLLRDGSQLGISLRYVVQDQPTGIAQAILLGSQFLGDDHFALILGDNIFYGQGLQDKLRLATDRTAGATVFRYAVKDPHRYGVVEVDAERTPVVVWWRSRPSRSRVTP